MRDTILFDGEGVVVDSEPIWDEGQKEFLRRRGISYDREKIKPLLAGRSMQDGVRILQSIYGFSGTPEALARERVEIVKNLFANKVQFIPGFQAFHSRLPRTFKSCIATMMPQELLNIVIERLNLKHFFQAHIYCPDSHLIQGKPAPDLFLFAASQLHSAPRQCIVIEDSPNGIEAARRADMFCIGIATTFEAAHLSHADKVVSSFDEIDLDLCT